ncbi:MAG: AAA family ATPase [Bacteroidales bacterium]|nr:AAA family ATPase [Bacteroidales bacterium]MBN2757813.1 AAA family ATPase [Bacteroidales bacterium]
MNIELKDNKLKNKYISMDKEINTKATDIFSYFDDDIHPGKLYIQMYNELYNNYAIYTTVNVEVLTTKLKELYNLNDDNYIYKEEISKSKKLDEVDSDASFYIMKIREKFIMLIANYKVIFYYDKNLNFDEIKEIVEIIKSSKKLKKHKSKFYMISSNNHSEYGFDFKKFKIKKQEISIEENYNSDFVETDNVIKEFLSNGKSNGLVILHGKYGTGKTSYIRSLMGAINKRFIFLPLNMMESISSPNFLPFISKYKNSVLVLEDCETLIKARNNGNSDNSLVNLLNLGDGLLSDALSIKLICTFNADLKEIDKAILRKGRLVARYEFKELEVDKAQALSIKLGNTNKLLKPTTLAEIFNSDKNDFGKLNGDKKIGY